MSEPGEARSILAIETSCDDTCAAVVTRDGEVRSNVVASQGLLHERYGGVVPEIAARRHLEAVSPTVDDALERGGVTLEEVGMVAVTAGPGLIGALLVGLSSAKALAAARELPLVAVDHLHGHVAAATLAPQRLEAPYLCLVASGGHTFVARVDEPARYGVLGRTLDDSAGEAFDKGARMLGLSYPGGPAIDRVASEGDPGAFAFPRARPGTGLDFSFSGLKTALLYRTRELGETETQRRAADLAASYQRAIVDALVTRTREALEHEGVARLSIGGGVAANSELRRRAGELGEEMGVGVSVPDPSLCTDNAAMIAGAARFLEPIEFPGYLDLDAFARTGVSVPVVTLYGKPGCHLCDDARAAVAAALADRPAELREVDVSLDPSLERAYGERIPVVAVDGEERFQYFVEVRALARLLDGLERSTD